MNAYITSHTALDNSIDFREVSQVGGLYAGICYSSYPFGERLALESPEASMLRYQSTIGRKHFSVGHNYQITVIFEDISKMMAILLNSFTFYNTCERSGRYTNMGQGNSDYEKWLPIFETLINAAYPDMDSVQVTKLAMENARYTLPLFNKMTTLAYTTSYVQFNFICGFFQRFIDRYEKGERYLDFEETMPSYENSFYENLIPEMKDIITALTELNIYDGRHGDNKDREITLFEDKAYSSPLLNVGEATVNGHGYEVVNAMTYPVLADLIRHRTTELSIISFNTPCTTGHRRYNDSFYTPQIFGLIGNTDMRYQLIKEWGDMMRRTGRTMSLIRQGHTVLVRETGRLDKFVLKAKERLCGRVQLEAMEVMQERIIDMCHDVAPKVYSNPYAYNTLSEIVDIPSKRIKSKCEIIGGCVEPCFFSGNKTFERKV